MKDFLLDLASVSLCAERKPALITLSLSLSLAHCVFISL